MPEFIPGLELGELFYRNAVRPILAVHFPGLAYDAAIVGPGWRAPLRSHPFCKRHYALLRGRRESNTCLAPTAMSLPYLTTST